MSVKSNAMEMMRNRTLVIATKHGKELVIGPLFQSSFGLRWVTDNKVDTDLLGTFTGEVEREGSPLETLRKKCQLAMDLTGHTMAVASEGSFGPHPEWGFVPADEEWVMLSDRAHGWEITAREISTATNFAGRELATEAELEHFAAEVGFPSHAIILRRSRYDHLHLIKGIRTWRQLRNGFRVFVREQGRVYAETDMRAMCNPTRMAVIRGAAEKLVEKIRNVCPVCEMPGFGVVSVRGGLPCSQCGYPTRSVSVQELSCGRCGHKEERTFPNGRRTEDPRYCDHCNP
ncbi:MAG: hypothetical protein RLY31_2379 [Bacteroidota bacterium]|jgi:hypothetical protein